jgi:hypothetical protein
VQDDKFVVLRRADVAMMSVEDQARLGDLAVNDAVVIRRQDLFAGPALHAYAANIQLATKLAGPSDRTNRLKQIADYFHEQAILADAEGWKVPD